MAVNRDPILKRCRSLGIEPISIGIDKKSNRQPKKSFRKMSEYGVQLKEKQKLKFIYGVLEKPFRNYYKRSTNMGGVTGENLLHLLERRLDNVVYRAGFASSRPQARQLVLHGHFLVNGKKVNISSYEIDMNDVLTVREKSKDINLFKLAREGSPRLVPKWLTVDADKLTCNVSALPAREDIDFTIQENMIVEFYSR